MIAELPNGLVNMQYVVSVEIRRNIGRAWFLCVTFANSPEPYAYDVSLWPEFACGMGMSRFEADRFLARAMEEIEERERTTASRT